jgi:hypothetical protein
MKIYKTTTDNTTTYFYDGVKKYVHFKNSDGHERWSEYDEKGNEIHFKNSDGYEKWSKDHPDNPDNKPLTEADVKPFEFGN